MVPGAGLAEMADEILQGLRLEVAAGQKVTEGQVVCVIEAMKMQNIIRAERDGVVAMVGAGAGDSVAADQVLVEFAA